MLSQYWKFAILLVKVHSQYRVGVQQCWLSNNEQMALCFQIRIVFHLEGNQISGFRTSAILILNGDSGCGLGRSSQNKLDK